MRNVEILIGQRWTKANEDGTLNRYTVERLWHCDGQSNPHETDLFVSLKENDRIPRECVTAEFLIEEYLPEI